MFKQRLLTTLVLVPIVLLAIYNAPGWILGAVVVGLIIFAGFEWLQLIPLQNRLWQFLFLSGLGVLSLLSMYGINILLVLNSIILWGFITVAVVTYPHSQRVWGYPLVVAVLGLVLLVVAASIFFALYKYSVGQSLIVYLFCLIWATDIGAYLIGKQWGRHKLIPQVSPGKTVEGVVGGLVLAMVVAFIGFEVFKPESMMIWFIVALSTASISVVGDLSISMLKRRSHIKDTGQLFPGHGGLLDRIDSLLAALPVFYGGLQVMHFGS